MTATQCCLVSPFWEALGWVRWHGAPNPERQMTIEYRRCQAPAVEPVTLDGFTFHWCAAHTKRLATKGDGQ